MVPLSFVVPAGWCVTTTPASGAPGAQVAEFGKLFHAAPLSWSESASSHSKRTTSEDPSPQQRQQLDQPTVVADQLQTTLGGNNCERGSGTSSTITTNRSKQYKAANKGNNNLADTSLCLPLDLKSLSALSLSSPRSARFKDPEIIAVQTRLSDMDDSEGSENESEDMNMAIKASFSAPTKAAASGSSIEQLRSGLGCGANEHEQTR